ncbi:MAG: TolC family protein, partial [Planctomycetia bacterium]
MRSKFTVCALVLSVFVSISGCTSPLQWWRNGAKVGPEYCRPHADVAPEWRDAGSPELNTTVSQDPCWWATFNDPVLNDLIATLHRQNLTLKTAAMRICEARAIRGVAVGNIFPQQQSFDGAYSRTEMSENTQFGSAGFLDLFSSDWTLGVGMAWELDFWGRFRRLVTSADANLESNIYTYDHAMVLL